MDKDINGWVSRKVINLLKTISSKILLNMVNNEMGLWFLGRSASPFLKTGITFTICRWPRNSLIWKICSWWMSSRRWFPMRILSQRYRDVFVSSFGLIKVIMSFGNIFIRYGPFYIVLPQPISSFYFDCHWCHIWFVCMLDFHRILILRTVVVI